MVIIDVVFTMMT
ncbi:hypothetical protein ACEPAG_9168 [Sanghuangporus baumii]